MNDEKEIDYDEMSDEEFMMALEEGAYASDSEEDDTQREEENFEDTDHTEDETDSEDLDAETNDQIDDEDQETEEEDEDFDEEEDEENTQLDDEAEDETDKDDDSEDEDSETNDDKESKDDDTKDSDDDDTEEVNYEEEYKKALEESERYKTFFNEVTSEFTANGKKMKGFDDPKKIIQAQQMAAGFSEKMAGFKPYRPFMSALKERGITEDPEKFNLAMNLLDGDPEALKKHIKDLDIDPFALDMDNINYQSKNQVSSDLELAFDDVMETASGYGIKDRVQEVIGKEWDDRSVIELLEDPQSSSDLIKHLNSGAYDVVQERIAEKKRIDINNVYSNKPMIEQYREAASELEAEYAARQQNAQTQNNTVEEPKVNEDGVKAEQERIAKEPEEAEYRAKVEAENAKAAEARKKATSVSKKKRRAKPTKKVFDPSDLSDEEFSNLLDNFQFAQ